MNPTTGLAGCCARAAGGHDTAAPPSATSNSRRPMVTVMRPSRARCVNGTYHATSVLSLTGGGTRRGLGNGAPPFRRRKRRRRMTVRSTK